jgi:hypothetical protein
MQCTPDQCSRIAKPARAAHAVLADDLELSGRALLFQALGNETRLKILGLVSVQELCVCDIVKGLGAAPTTTAFHLRMLGGLPSTSLMGASWIITGSSDNQLIKPCCTA